MLLFSGNYPSANLTYEAVEMKSGGGYSSTARNSNEYANVVARCEVNGLSERETAAVRPELLDSGTGDKCSSLQPQVEYTGMIYEQRHSENETGLSRPPDDGVYEDPLPESTERKTASTNEVRSRHLH